MKTTLLNYTWKTGKGSILALAFILLAGIITFFAVLCCTENGFTDQWSTWIEAYVSFTTVLIAIFIWSIEKNRAYRDQLPKKLNVTYIFNQQKWEIINAPLVSEADIRPWGQSLGKNLFHEGGFFDFVRFKIDVPTELKTKTQYHLSIYLTDALKSEDIHLIEYDDDGTLLTKLPERVK